MKHGLNVGEIWVIIGEHPYFLPIIIEAHRRMVSICDRNENLTMVIGCGSSFLNERQNFRYNLFTLEYVNGVQEERK